MARQDKWRILAYPPKEEKVSIEKKGGFDELVVGNWLHIEKMDRDTWWMRVGDACINVRIKKRKIPEVEIMRGAYSEICGETHLSPDANKEE